MCPFMTFETMTSVRRALCRGLAKIITVGLCSSLLLSSEHNILRFLEETVHINDKLFAKAREDILKFLNEYIKFLGRRVQEHALAIKVPTRSSLLSH